MSEADGSASPVEKQARTLRGHPERIKRRARRVACARPPSLGACPQRLGFAATALRACSIEATPPPPRRTHWLAAVAALALACTAPAEPPAVARGGSGLGRLDLGELRLLPRAAVTAPPSVAPPAFERRAPSGPGLSLGPTNAGVLRGAVSLPTAHPALSIRDTTLARRAHFGTPGLVTALTNAAERVARDFPGSVLWAGDLSLETGGPFAPHASHTNGRDADLAFYVSELGPDGLMRPMDRGAMQAVSADGLMAGKRFDAVRNWALVKALLEDPHVSVQWVFVASHLRAMLLEEARRGDPELAARAERVLAQPGDSSPHADHFHVRVYCGLEERLEGCLDAPPFHPFADRHEAAVNAWLDGLLPFLATPHLPETRDAIEHIVRMNATAAIPHLAALVDRLAAPAPSPESAELGRLAADALAFLRGQRTPSAWRQWRALDVGD